MKPIVLLVCLLYITSCAPSPDSAQNLAHRTVEAMGGKEGLDNIRYLRFDFRVEVDGNEVYVGRHLWDRQSGRYREEWELFGEKAQVLFNIFTKEGRAYRDGVEVDAADIAEVLEQAYYNHLNDTYWLLMPWKLTDPGVTLSNIGRESVGDKTVDVLHLSFSEGVGETSGDQHWLYINSETGFVEQSAYFLERFEKDDPSLDEATIWEWTDWTETGGVQFATDRKVLRTVHDPFETAHNQFTLVVALDEVDDAVFASLSVPMPDK